MATRVFHWKHGWIPLDAYARAIVAEKKRGAGSDTKPSAKALERAKARQSAYWAKAQQTIKVPSEVKSVQQGGYRITTVNGFPEVRFKEVLEVSKRPPEQYKEVAKVIQDALKPYPRVTADGPLEVGWSNELTPDVMADTNMLGGHRIRLQPSMWDDNWNTMRKVDDMKSRKFGVTAEAADVETFRRNVITHELGHVIHMKDQDEVARTNGVPTISPEMRTALPFGEIGKFAEEKVKPRDFGFTDVDPPTNGPYALDQPTARWQVDSLNHQSAYALSDPFEFYAEAFLEGTLHGDKATESGKRAVALARKIFGPNGKATP